MTVFIPGTALNQNRGRMWPVGRAVCSVVTASCFTDRGMPLSNVTKCYAYIYSHSAPQTALCFSGCVPRYTVKLFNDVHNEFVVSSDR
jgi:hypothetical protein